MNFEDALRQVIFSSEEDLLTFSQRASVNFYDFLSFVNEGKNLKSQSQMEKIRDNLNNEDHQKLLFLLNR